MASIHDVAKLAGVSTATVSKHINKAGYISPEKREAIDAAIATLGYAPNRSARMLKTNTSKDILLVVPNMTERIYREVAESLSAFLAEKFRVIIQLSNDVPANETRILQDCLNNPCAGLLLVTCQPRNTDLFERLQKKFPIIFLMRQPERLVNDSFVGFNHFDAIYSLVTELCNLGFTDMALFAGSDEFSCEHECIAALQTVMQLHGYPLKPNRIFSAQFRKESTFRTIMRLFDTDDHPQVMLCTSSLVAQAISDVAFFRNLQVGRDLFIITLGEDSWYNSIFINRIIATYRDARKLGTVAASSLLENIESPMVYEPISIKLPDNFDFKRMGHFMERVKQNTPVVLAPVTHKKLRLAFNSADAGTVALRCLLPQYTQMRGVEVEMTAFTHDDLYALLCRQAREGTCEYDLLAVDASWVSYLSSTGGILDLTAKVQASDIPTRLSPMVLDRVSTTRGKIWGVPHTYSLQMLYYRKDFFENPDLAAAFYEQYRVELAPPKNWHMYNIIANFFSRAHNPQSPCAHGTTIYAGVCPSALCSDLYPRIWAYHGSIIDARGQVQLYRPENLRAYQSFLDSLAESSLQQEEFMHLDNMHQLMNGEVAMCIAFSNNAGFLLDSSDVSQRNKIGFTPIPEHKPVISGWSVGINANSPHTEQAWDFIQWFSDMEIASAYTILGGAAPMTTLLEQESLVQMYPWNTLARKEYHTGTHRETVVLPNAQVLDHSKVEKILADVVYDCIHRNIPLKSALLRAHKALCAYAESCGYPHNVPLTASALEGIL